MTQKKQTSFTTNLGKSHVEIIREKAGIAIHHLIQYFITLFLISSFRGVIEWIMCLLFDCFLLILEVSVNLWLASSLYDNNLPTPYTAIMIILFVPCLINPVLWLKLKSSYKFTTCLVFVLLMLPPSPFFL